ncbi:unnamed protein product, partial [Effrenium voratum]
QTEFAQQFRAAPWPQMAAIRQSQSHLDAQRTTEVGVLFMGISQTMSMLRMSSIFGPLVSMT